MQTKDGSFRFGGPPFWLWLLLAITLVLSPVALLLTISDPNLRLNLIIPALLGSFLLLVMVYWLLHIRRVEKTLAQERNLLRTVIDNLPALIYVKDRQGRKIISNIADWQASGGKTIEDVIGKTDFEVYPADLAARFSADDKTVIDTGVPIIDREEPARDQQGNPTWLLTSKVPLRDGQGNVVGLVGTGRDITERRRAEEAQRKAEEKYRSFFENSIEGIFQTTPQGRFITANPALAQMLGYDSPEELIVSVTDLDRPIVRGSSHRSELGRRLEEDGKGIQL